MLSGDERLALALTTIEWLKQTKELNPSQQLGLSLRAIEQVLSEVEERHWRVIVHDRLFYSWSLARIGDTLFETVYRAIFSLSGGVTRVASAQQQSDFLEVKDYVMGGDSFKLRRALERLAWLRQRVETPSRLARELGALESRLASGPATANGC